MDLTWRDVQHLVVRSSKPTLNNMTLSENGKKNPFINVTACNILLQMQTGKQMVLGIKHPQLLDSVLLTPKNLQTDQKNGNQYQKG